VFERFTDRARRVLVMAQEEARHLNHGFIGTEHILLGLMHEGDGIAAQALTEMDVSLEAVRESVSERIKPVRGPAAGSPPFTPRAKKVLELSLREALQLGHNYIGTEHLLLGIVREGEGVAAQVLVSVGADLHRVRQTVIGLLGSVDQQPEMSREAEQMTSGSWIGRGPVPSRRTRFATCSFCGRQPPETGRLIAGENAYICEHCLDELSQDKPANGEAGDEE
jgi:ATP-dependent Clp protease ATP-binding subunit ClpC